MLTFEEYFDQYQLMVLTEGGAAGHMQHPFDLPTVSDGNKLIQFFKDAAVSLQQTPASLKIDGVNASFKLVDTDLGGKEFALDRGSMKPLDVSGITIDKLLDRFGEGHGMVQAGEVLLSIFNSAIPQIEGELKELGMWSDSDKFLNTEFVQSKTNVQEYDHNFLAIHGVNEFEQVTPKRRASKEVNFSTKAMESLIAKVGPIAQQHDFIIYGSVPVNHSLDSMPNYDGVLNEPVTVVYALDNSVTKPLRTWLMDAKNPYGDRIKLLSGKDIGALSKAVYMHMLNGQPLADLVGDDVKAQKSATDGAIIYHATRVLGNELLSHLDSPMGKANTHEGVVIRDPKFGNKPVKVTGDFIISGLESAFRKPGENEEEPEADDEKSRHSRRVKAALMSRVKVGRYGV